MECELRLPTRYVIYLHVTQQSICSQFACVCVTAVEEQSNQIVCNAAQNASGSHMHRRYGQPISLFECSMIVSYYVSGFQLIRVYSLTSAQSLLLYDYCY